MTYLKRLPVHQLKVNRLFVRHMHDSQSSR
jgi:EAL domain-containing protein (putative c-di-GMP-specific phosphodiesterase class I)